jgi:hypothetical protein
MSDGYWTRTVTDGNTVTFTSSSGRLAVTVLEGNTPTKTYPDETLTVTYYDLKDGSRTSTDSYESWWQRIVVGENTMTETDSLGDWSRAVINGNTITVTSLDGRREEVINKQGNDVFLTLTGSYSFTDIGVSERDRVQNTIDGITSGRLTDGKFYELIDYGR